MSKLNSWVLAKAMLKFKDVLCACTYDSRHYETNKLVTRLKNVSSFTVFREGVKKRKFYGQADRKANVQILTHFFFNGI